MTESMLINAQRQSPSAFQAEEQNQNGMRDSLSESDGELSAEEAGTRKRKRGLKISCELCKARKVKCDRVEPSCGWCTRNNRKCIYNERKKPGIRVGYGLELEAKINRVEAMLQVLGRRVEDHISEHQTSLHLTSNTLPESRWHENHTASDSNLSENIQTGSEFPPNDLLYPLVDLYFKHINPWSPVLDAKTTFDKLFHSRSLTDSDQVLLHAIVATSIRFSQDSRLTPNVLERFQENSRRRVEQYVLENNSIQALQAATVLAVDILGTSNKFRGRNLLSIISRNIVELGMGIEKTSYISKPIYHSVGSLQHSLLQQPTSWIEDEGRRRLFWMVYALDRYSTLSSDFNFILDDQGTDRSLPCRYDLFSNNQPVETKRWRSPDSFEVTTNRPENLGSFSYHCEVLRILTLVHKFLRHPLDIGSSSQVRKWRDTYRSLDGELNKWLHNLPGEYGQISQLCHNDPASKISNWIMLHAAFVTSVIRLHSAAAYPVVVSSIFEPSYNAMHRCLGAVDSLREIAQDVVNTGMLGLLGPQFAFSLWISAGLLLVHAATTGEDIDPNIHFFITTLEQLGSHWEVAQTYATILHRVLPDDRDQLSRLSAMRRSIWDLDKLLSKKSVATSASIVRTPGMNELEYFEVFEFFNYPRPLDIEESSRSTKEQYRSSNFATPNPDSDWLLFRP